MGRVSFVEATEVPMDGHEFAAPRSDNPTPPPSPTPEALDDAPVDVRSFSGVLDALLRRPAPLLEALRDARGAEARVLAIALVGIASTGLLVASWSGGLQLAVVPIKLVLLASITALVCLPSLHVLSALSGGGQPIAQTSGALSMGVALTAVIALALAPIAWVLSAATDSLALTGTLYLCVFLISAGLGLGLVRRAMATSAGMRVRGLGAWSFLFVLVALQLATTMRPLVGSFDGFWLHERTFFLAHIADCLSR
jgi:hypothetical protein